MFYEFKISTIAFIRGWRRLELTAKISVSLKIALTQAKTGGFERNF